MVIRHKRKIAPLANVNAAIFNGKLGSILVIISHYVHPPTFGGSPSTLPPIGSQAPPCHVIFFI